MKNIASLLKVLRPATPVYQQLELPLAVRQLTPRQQKSLTRLRQLRARIALL